MDLKALNAKNLSVKRGNRVKWINITSIFQGRIWTRVIINLRHTYFDLFLLTLLFCFIDELVTFKKLCYNSKFIHTYVKIVFTKIGDHESFENK